MFYDAVDQPDVAHLVPAAANVDGSNWKMSARHTKVPGDNADATPGAVYLEASGHVMPASQDGRAGGRAAAPNDVYLEASGYVMPASQDVRAGGRAAALDDVHLGASGHVMPASHDGRAGGLATAPGVVYLD